jgi:hypothetical protein
MTVPNTRPPLRRIPWERIVLVLGAAAIVAWIVGFIAGLIVRWRLGS